MSKIDTATTVLGYKISMPIMVAPTAMQKMAHVEGTDSLSGLATYVELINIRRKTKIVMTCHNLSLILFMIFYLMSTKSFLSYNL